MRKLLKGALLMALTAVATTTVHAQVVQLTVEEYQQLKLEGALPAEYHVAYTTLPVAGVTADPAVKPHKGGQPKGGGEVNGNCNCWIAPDGDYTLAMSPNDDGSSALINLPFSFNLYGELYNTCYINNNGNVSFVNAYGTYTAAGFPSADYKMVAPFWADVDTRGTGSVYYRITNTAMYVNWVEVGYFNMQTDKLNSFQLVISDGTDPVIGVGNNVAFCYLDMAWTTGSASCLSPTSCTYGGESYSCANVNNLGYGFCGAPSTIGANRGNAADFIQFTRNDHPGLDYDGPFGGSDGVDWLDFKNFQFTTAVSTQNIPPITSSSFLCDTVQVCMGELVTFNVQFLTPEQDQLIIGTTAVAPTIDNFAYTVNNNGTSATVNVQFIPTVVDTGFHVVTFTATDNGPDSLVTTATIVLEIFYTESPPPTITGDTIACEGVGTVLTAGPGYDDYIWTNGYFGRTILVGPGTYICLATAGNCRLASNIITVVGAPSPQPVITGAQVACGGVPSVLNTSESYETYTWSNGSHDPSVTVGTGNYSVTVTDDNGCEGTSAGVNVVSGNDPVALFASDNLATVFPGTTITYTDQSTIDGSTITSYVWSIDTLYTGVGTTIEYLFETPGNYPVTLTVTTAQGCVSVYTLIQHVIPTEIIVPNVFSPNGDGNNDALTFSGVEFYDNSSLKVMNRWGQEVFSSGNYKNTWRPTDVSEGTYYYILKVSNGKEFTGHVTLLR